MRYWATICAAALALSSGCTGDDKGAPAEDSGPDTESTGSDSATTGDDSATTDDTGLVLGRFAGAMLAALGVSLYVQRSQQDVDGTVGRGDQP